MTRLLLKLILMITILFLVLNLADTYLLFDRLDLNKYIIGLKQEHYSKHQYNAVFIGSSRVYRQISPETFDSYMNNSTNSFNFGIPAYSQQDSINLFRNILSRKAPLPKTVFMELGVPADPANVARPVKARLLQLQIDFDRFTKRGMGPSLVNMFLVNHAFKKPVQDQIWIGRNNDGYYPLDINLADKISGFGELQLRRLKFEGDPQAASKAKKVSKQALMESTGGKYNTEAKKKLTDLISEASKKDIKLIFMVMPLMNDKYKDIMPLACELPPTNLLNLAAPSEFPEFYDAKYMFDQGHLNGAGAKIFTEKLSLKYKLLPQ